MEVVRTTRARVIHLRNDYKLIMSRLENAVHAQFAAQSVATSQPAATPSFPSTARQEEGVRADTPFAKVNSVVLNSPAADAGLQAGDKVTRFGAATWLNHDRLAKVAQIVSQNEGVSHQDLFLSNSMLNFVCYRSRFSWLW